MCVCVCFVCRCDSDASLVAPLSVVSFVHLCLSMLIDKRPRSELSLDVPTRRRHVLHPFLLFVFDVAARLPSELACLALAEATGSTRMHLYGSRS